MSDVTYRVEELVLELLGRSSALNTFDKRHHDRSGKTEVQSIVVQATKGGKLLEGCEPWDCPCAVTFASATLTPEQADDVQSAIIDAVVGFNPLTDPPLPDLGLTFIHFEQDQISENRQDTSKLRVRTVTFPFLAL